MSETATFAAGCFWGIEAKFRQLPGILSTRVGYTGGTTASPIYEDVCTEMTGHVEAVEVVYDPTTISYNDLLKVFWESHDPTTMNRQGPDVGTQYRSVIFHHDEAQRVAALVSRGRFEAERRFKRPTVTEIVPAVTFYPAEEHHQRYFEKLGLTSCHVSLAQ